MSGTQMMERYFTEREEAALLKAARRIDCPMARRDVAWMTLARHTGIRVRALVGLTVGDAEQALADRRLILRPEIQKGRLGHGVLLVKPAELALRRLLRVRRELGGKVAWDAPLVVNRYGRAITVRALQKRQAYWCAEAGVRAGSPHWWRHTCARRLMDHGEAKDPRGTVMRVLGHRSINTSAIYSMPTHEQIREAMERAA